MIIIRRNVGEHSLTVQGHADGARNGHDHDLLCCAVSTILQTLVASLIAMDDGEPVYSLKPGDAYVQASHDMRDWRGVKARFDMAMDGLRCLAVHNPDNLKIER